jgi:phage anti-repressor protein
MGELIKIDFNEEDFYESKVSARRIYELLKVRQEFATWFKYHAKNMKLVEGEHYTKVTQKDRHKYESLDLTKLSNQKSGDGDEKFCLTKLSSKKTGRGGHNKIEYVIPVRIAEHLAMASNTAMAYKIRDIFIDIKNRYLAEKDADKALWVDPDFVIARALQMAEKKISDITLHNL